MSWGYLISVVLQDQRQVVSFFGFFLKWHRFIFVECLDKRRKKLISFNLLLEVTIEMLGLLTRRQRVIVNLKTLGL